MRAELRKIPGHDESIFLYLKMIHLNMEKGEVMILDQEGRAAILKASECKDVTIISENDTVPAGADTVPAGADTVPAGADNDA